MTDRPRIILATQNQDKIREIKHILGSLPVEFLPLNALTGVKPVVEDGATFEANAIGKARGIWEQTGQACLADDSGLEVDALGGEPGVRSARFAGEEATYEANNRKLIRLLKDVAPAERTARFVCVACLVTTKGKMVVQRGELDGLIVDQPRGSGGFGYDPIFYLPRYEKTVAELDAEVKNSISHRAKAFRAMQGFIAALCSPRS